MDKNVFTYWQGPKTDLIIELEKRLRKVCDDNGYRLFELDDQSIHDYIDIPDYFSNATHVIDISDLIRIELLTKYGGIWLDKDVLVFKGFDHLFQTIEDERGFIVGIPMKHRMGINNAILGSLTDCEFYQKWRQHNHNIVQQPKPNWFKLPFGVNFLKKAKRESLIQGIKIFNGYETRMEFFGNLRVAKLLMDLDPECVMEADPSLVHLFDRNCRVYNRIDQEQREKTLLYKLLNYR